MPDKIVLVNGRETAGRLWLEEAFREETVNVFETMRVCGKEIQFLDEHMNRLFESAKTIGLTIPKTKQQIKKELESAIRQFGADSGANRSAAGAVPGSGRGRGGASENLSVRLTTTAFQTIISISERAWPSWIYEKGVDLQTSPVRRNLSNSLPPEAKSNQFLNAVEAELHSFEKPPFAFLFLGSEGYVRECGTWNFFIVRNGALATPPPAGILNGVTRRFVIKCARKERIPVEETFFTRHDVWNGDEAFITNSTAGIVPVRSLDARMIGEEVPGPVTHKLRQKFP